MNTQGDFKKYMIAYIREHFTQLLGEHTALLDEEDGLEQLSELLRGGLLGHAPTGKN
jgi:hypothetical protein